MSKLLTIIICLLFTSNVFSFDKTVNITLDELEDFSVKDNGVKLNNFSLHEGSSFLGRGLTNLELSFSVRNKNEKPRHFSVMMAGWDKEEYLIWALDAEPMMSTVSGNKTETVKSDSYVSPGVLKSTKWVWVRIVGDF